MKAESNCSKKRIVLVSLALAACICTGLVLAGRQQSKGLNTAGHSEENTTVSESDRAPYDETEPPEETMTILYEESIVTEDETGNADIGSEAHSSSKTDYDVPAAAGVGFGEVEWVGITSEDTNQTPAAEEKEKSDAENEDVLSKDYVTKNSYSQYQALTTQEKVAFVKSFARYSDFYSWLEQAKEISSTF